MGPGFKAAIVQTDALEIRALPRGAVFYDREPVFTVTGPSALVSWLEPLVLMLHYRIQVASRAEQVRVVTCERQREIVRETLDAVGLPAPAIEVDSDGYYRRVLGAAKALVEAVKNPDRIFEVGMRSASCLEQHEIALRACREAGIQRTSNVLLARTLGMIPVGTMGHEHVQRYGADEPAFRAMRERRPGRSSYLLDTYSGKKLGLASTGNDSRSVGENPSVGPTNFYLAPGTKTAQDIIQTVKQGLYVTDLIGFGINMVTGDYSRGAAGFWIEGGELAYPVEEITIASNLKDMFAGIEMIGNDLVFRGRIASPTVKLAEMMVAGS
jgi:hypothetical protein